MATIATHVGHSISEDHNLRDEKKTSKDGHIDPSKTPLNETIYYESIKDAYHTLFDDSVAEYNAKQTRADRCIDDYYQKIAQSKQKHPAYEMIIGVYNKTDKGKVIEAEREFSDEVGKEIMKEFVAGWANRNPNLHMTGAHYHADEDGQPHIHIDFIPVIDNCARGMRRQTAFDKALQRQGFKKKEAVYELNEDGSQKLDENNKPIQKQAWSTPQMQWEASENKALEDLCLARGLTVEHPDRDAGGRRHEHTDDYKQSKDELRELQEQIAKEQEAQRQEAERHAKHLQELREQHDKEIKEKKEKEEKEAAERREAEKKKIDEIKQQQQEAAEQAAQEAERREAETMRQIEADKLRIEGDKEVKAWTRDINNINPKKSILGALTNTFTIKVDDWNEFCADYNALLKKNAELQKEPALLKVDNKKLTDDNAKKDAKIAELRELRQNEGKASAKKIQSLEETIKNKDKTIVILNDRIKRLKENVCRALMACGVAITDKIKLTIGSKMEAAANRSYCQELGDNEKLEDVTITIKKDSIGMFGIVTAANKEWRILSGNNFDKIISNHCEAYAPEQTLELKTLSTTNGKPFMLLAKKVSELESKEGSGGGITLRREVKERLREMERNKTRSF